MVVAQKTVCSVTKKQFMEGAKPFEITLPNGSKVMAEPKEFSTGSFGWFYSDKADMPVGDTKVRCTVQFMSTVVGSKEAKRE